MKFDVVLTLAGLRMLEKHLLLSTACVVLYIDSGSV